jgi:hypothetical protein
MARKKKRTKAERSATAKASWARRRAAAARGERLKVLEGVGRAMKAKEHAPIAEGSPDKSMAMSVLEATRNVGWVPVDSPLVMAVDNKGDALRRYAAGESMPVVEVRADNWQPVTPGVVKEGDAPFLTQSFRDGSHSRQRISEDGARKLFKELGAILL